jgi:transposase
LSGFCWPRGERVVRVPTKLMADVRRAARTRGKSDSIDAVAVARAALREGLDELPTAVLDGPELDLRLLVDHRERLVRQRVGLNNTLQWHLHDMWPELELPGGALFSKKWTDRIGRRLARAQQTMRVRIARDELRRLRELTHAIKDLEKEIAELVAQAAPQLLDEPGFGPLTAASSSARSPAPAASQATPSSHAPPAWRRSQSVRARPTATASIAAATARSTPRSTALPSLGRGVIPRPRTTSPASRPKARPPGTRSAPSSATSPAVSGSCCARPPP